MGMLACPRVNCRAIASPLLNPGWPIFSVYANGAVINTWRGSAEVSFDKLRRGRASAQGTEPD